MAAATAALLRQALAAGDDARAAALIREAADAGETLLGATFEELGAAAMPAAAVALAHTEAAGDSLADAEGTADGGSYLHAAAGAGAGAKVLAALVAAGCVLDSHGGEGATALRVAARAGHAATCRTLLELGADPLARNSHGRTPRMQGGVGEETKALLGEAEDAARRRRADAQAALWDGRMRAAQTDSAFRVGCL